MYEMGVKCVKRDPLLFKQLPIDPTFQLFICILKLLARKYREKQQVITYSLLKPFKSKI